jgi:hypothetical protein
MDKRRSPVGPLRAPLGHWLIAIILAAAVAWGVRAWFHYRVAQSAQTATLAWDAAAARQMDPDVESAAEPAVVMAQSILSDAVVAKLAKAAALPSPGTTLRIGEFRSRLELRQTSADALQVGFRADSPQRSVQTANAVADVLAGGTAAVPRTPVATPAAAATPPPAELPPAAPVKVPVANSSAEANGALGQSIRQLAGEMTATQGKLESLSSDAWQRREHPELSSYRESRQQQLLTAQVSSALKQIAHWRADPANGPEAQEPLNEIQESLLSVWPASRSERGARRPAGFMGFNAAGVNASRLRVERSEFARAVEVVKKEEGALQRLEPPAAAPQPAAPAPAAVEPAASAPAPSAPAAGAGPIAESNLPSTPAEKPFRLLRPAGTPPHPPLWPGVLAGVLVGMVYLFVAGSRYTQEEEEEYADESPEEPHRLITPSKPMRPADFFERPAEPPAEAPTESAEVRPAEIVLPAPQIEKPDPPAEQRSDPGVQEIVVPAGETRRPFREEVASEENQADPWIDHIMKNLSETSIGRMYEKPGAQNCEGEPSQETEGRRLSIHPGRLAG